MLISFTETVNRPEEEGSLGLGHIEGNFGLEHAEGGISRIFKCLGSIITQTHTRVHIERENKKGICIAFLLSFSLSVLE